MLVLTRKQKQQIQIGDNITVTILRVKGSAVRIGIEAPNGVRVLRNELIAAQMDDLGEETEAVGPKALPPIHPSTRNVLERMLATC